jgi:hypothetical protein
MSTPTITNPATAAHSGGGPGAPKFWLGAPEPAWTAPASRCFWPVLD